MRVLIADDHAVVRSGVMQLLTEEFGPVAIGEAKDAREAVGAAREQAWDIAIVDISMPGRSGLDALKELRAMRPELPVLIYSAHPEEQFALRALKAGAAGYLSKDALGDELAKAVRAVLRGGKYVSAALAQRLAGEVGTPAERLPHERLSDREYQILCLIGAGKTAKEIATQLALSINTISTHRVHILAKMKMQTNAELTRYAVENKLDA